MRSRQALDHLIALILVVSGVWIFLRLPPLGSAQSATSNELIGSARDWACLLGVIGCLIPVLHFWGSRPVAGRKHRDFFDAFLLLAIPTALAAFLLYNRIAVTKMERLSAGGLYVWLDDDMMISMRYAQNLAHGHGLTWNGISTDTSMFPHSRVEGFTNFLWTLALALPHLAGLPPRLTSAPVLVANAALLVMVLVLVARVGPQWGLADPLIWLALLILAANRWLIYWAAGGSEAIALALLLLLACHCVMNSHRKRKAGAGLGLILGLIGLIRADGLVLAGSFSPALLVLWRHDRLRARVFLLMLGLPAMHIIFSRLYYGDWLPNTYYLKAVDIPLREAMGLHYIQEFIYGCGAICGLHLAGLRYQRHPLAAWLMLPPWACIAYSTLIGGDELPEYRFLVPVVPLLILGAFRAAQGIFIPSRRRRAGHFAPRLSYAGVVLVIGLLSARTFCLPYLLSQLGTHRGELEKSNVQIGLMLKKNTSPLARIAHHWAGAAPYFSERPALDMLGKNDRSIAHLPGHADQWPPGHTKYDAAYSLALEPDVIVTALPADQAGANARHDPQTREAYPGLYALYSEPLFQSDYAPGLVPLGLSRDFHAIFVRRDSALALPPERWQE